MSILRAAHDWLAGDPDVAAAVGDRISLTTRPDDATPCLRYAATVSTVPTGQGQAGDVTLHVTVTCVGGRTGDAPDRDRAWTAADAIRAATARVSRGARPVCAGWRITGATLNSTSNTYPADTGWGQVICSVTLKAVPVAS